MPLYDISSGCREIDPKRCERYESNQKIKKSLHPKDFENVVKIVDDAVDHLRPSEKSKLIWTRMSALFGDEAKPEVQYLWNSIKSITGEEFSMIAIGGLLQWRLALRNEIWLLHKQVLDEVDDRTGKNIEVSHYWIDETFVPFWKKPKDTFDGINQLANRWGAKIRDDRHEKK